MATDWDYRMGGETDPNKHWQVVLYAADQILNELPPELFCDDDLIIHNSNLEKPAISYQLILYSKATNYTRIIISPT